MENSQLKEENKELKDRLSDLSETLKTNKSLLQEMADKVNEFSLK